MDIQQLIQLTTILTAIQTVFMFIQLVLIAVFYLMEKKWMSEHA